MKSFILFPLLILLFLSLTSCEVNDFVVESPKDTNIKNLAFTVDKTYIESGSNRLVATGRVTNTGSAQVTSPWYIEAQFYTSKNSSAKLGGGNTQIDVPLNSGQSTLWTIYYSSANVDARSYPDFDIRDFRGIYK